MLLGPSAEYRIPIPPGVEHIPDVLFGVGDGYELHLEIVRSRKPPARPAPAIAWIHGGGWSWNNRRGMFERLFHLAEAGYFCIAPEYRLSDRAMFPGPLYDVKCSIRWLRAHAAQYNVDPTRIGIWGGSAGAHLAALLALTPECREFDGTGGWPRESSAVQAAVDFFAPTNLLIADDFAPGIKSAIEHRSADSCEGRLLGGTPADNDVLAREASPLMYITRDAPPFLIMHGALDDVVPVSHSERFHEALRVAGVDSTLIVLPQGKHSAIDWGEEYLDTVKRFFDRCLVT